MSQLNKIKTSIAELKLKGHDGVYMAGLPSYNRNFSRDSFIYGFLASDYKALEAQINYSAEYQGTKSDPETGEEKGKIHHELPGRKMNGLISSYNACDTTALFLLSIAAVAKHKPESNVIDKYKDNIKAACDYIMSHVDNDLFWEDPTLAKAKRFALNVTYWKDSVLNDIENKPDYPIVYSLAHFQNASALIEIGKVLNDHAIRKQGETMIRVGLRKLWVKDHFVTALEFGGIIIDSLSTDSLYSLCFIARGSLPRTYASKIQKYSKSLETSAGYRSGIPDRYNNNPDQYHTRYVWVYEQAVLNIAAHQHHLRRAIRISSRIVPHLKQAFAEELDTKENFKVAGDFVQLWSIGAAIYFLNAY
jgi:glycogen debranching enzyme